MKDEYLEKYRRDELFDSWKKIVAPIIDSDEFQKRKYMKHHDDSVYAHSVSVSFNAYKRAKRKNKNEEFCKNVAIAGLLHDFYTRAWQYSESLENIDDKHKVRFTDKKNNKDLHGFTHATDALNNSKEYFPELMNERIEDAIKKHMFPLNIKPPIYKEGWYVTMMDKYVSFKKLPNVKELPKYVGLEKK